MSDKEKHDPGHQAQTGRHPEQAPRASGPDQPSPENSGEMPAAPGQEAEGDKPAGPKQAKREAEIKALRQEGDELKDKYLRALAEMENLRKRAEREKSEYFQYALAGVLQDVLAVLDSLERALRTGDQVEGRVFQEGVRMIHRQLLDVLARQGVTPIAAVVGRPFDPELHQALASEEADDVREAVVAEELQRGYRLHDRLLRPAQVRVKIPRPPVTE